MDRSAEATRGPAFMKLFMSGGRKVIVVYLRHGSELGARFMEQRALRAVKDGRSWLFCFEGIDPGSPERFKRRVVEMVAPVEKAVKLKIGIADPIVGMSEGAAINKCLKDNPDITRNDIAGAIFIARVNSFLRPDLPESEMKTLVAQLANDLGRPVSEINDVRERLNYLFNADPKTSKETSDKITATFDKLNIASNELSREVMDSALVDHPDKNLIFLIGGDHYPTLRGLLDKYGFIEEVGYSDGMNYVPPSDGGM